MALLNTCSKGAVGLHIIKICIIALDNKIICISGWTLYHTERADIVGIRQIYIPLKLNSKSNIHVEVSSHIAMMGAREHVF